jgi:deoxyribonuclease IV
VAPGTDRLHRVRAADYPHRMRIGAHIHAADLLTAVREREAQIAQFFLADPQGYKAPKPHPQAPELLAAGVDIYIHAPYIVNVATTNNRIRIPSRKLAVQHATTAAQIGAKGLIVHGGHVNKGDDAAIGFDNWRKFIVRQLDEGGFPLQVLIENTAGGDNAMARKFDALAGLWDAVGEFDVGFCLDTCHAWAAGEKLLDVVDRVRAITGRIDLVHLNNSRDAFDSGADRHANIADGTIDGELLAQVCASAGAPVLVETPAEGQAEDIAFLRSRLGRDE